MSVPARADAEKGVVLIASALVIVALCLFAGLVIDAGMLQQQRGQAQIAADAAAVAGAMQLLPGQNNAWWSSAALDAARWNGFRNDGGTSVLVTADPGARTVRVRITREVGTSFMSILGVRTVPVAVTAVGAIGAGGNSAVLAQ